MKSNPIAISLAVLILSFVTPLHAEEVNLPNPDFEIGKDGWSLSPEVEVVAAPTALNGKLHGNILSLPGGAFANAHLDLIPEKNVAYVFRAMLAPSQSELPTNAQITIFLHRGSETRNVAAAGVTWLTTEGRPRIASVEYVQADAPEEGWKLGVQVLAQDRGVLADDASLTAEPLAAPILLEGEFGKAEINPARPGMETLTLRRPDGSLEPKSLLADPSWPWIRDGLPWAHGACTYVIDDEGVRYDSRQAKPAGHSLKDGILTLEGVTLRSSPDSEPVARENWTLRTEDDGLVWQVEREWLQPMNVRLEGSPAIFMSMRGLADKPSPNVPNGVVSTMWVQPDRIAGRFDPLYRPATWHDGYRASRNNVQWLKDRDQWAIHKLFTNWEQASDLRLDPTGGYLYRRGFMGWLTETGIITATEPALKTAGTTEMTTLRISPVDKSGTGYQFAVELPDTWLQERLSSFYSSLMNGGVVNDQVNYNFGNETDGWFYGGAAWMQGLALSAGVPASGAVSHAPLDVATGFRKHLAAILGTVSEDGRSHFGYNVGGNLVDDNVHAVIGMQQYYLHTGDIAFVRQQLPILEKMLEVYIGMRNADGLFDMGAGGHQYYDAVPISGVSGYHNSFFYGALRAMAELQRVVGEEAKAADYDRIGDEVKEAYSRVLWAEDAPGGPRYYDWITHNGEEVTYCSDVSQFPALAFGIASPEQAKKLLATIDARIEELKKSHNYGEMASLSAYWPQPPHLQYSSHTFPIYMNGGGFFAQTYWEIMARARYGDRAGAFNRLEKFARGSAKLNWVGNNWVQIHGDIGFGGSDEPYLSDMVVVNAALVHGILGVRPSVEKIEVTPALPEGWTTASATILYMGKPHRIVIDKGSVTVTEVDQPGFNPPSLLDWEVSARGPSNWDLSIKRYFDSGGGWSADPSLAMDNGGGLRLRREIPPGTVLGTWDFREAINDYVPDQSYFKNPARLTRGSIITQDQTDGAAAGTLMAGATSTTVATGEGPDFQDGNSFTIQARFRTTSDQIGVMAGRGGLFCFNIKNGRLAAWLRGANGEVVEALGSRVINDGEWHDAQAVYDFDKMEISLLLDGVLDTEDGSPSAQNPVGFSNLGPSAMPGPLTLGSLAGSFFFTGTLQSVSLRSGLPTDTGGTIPESLSASGRYTSKVFHWNQPVRPASLDTDIELHGGKVAATVETSNDNFATVAETQEITMEEGGISTALSFKVPATSARVRLDLNASPNHKQTPRVKRFVLSGHSES